MKTTSRPLIDEGSNFPVSSNQVRHLLGELSDQKLGDWEIEFSPDPILAGDRLSRD
jgi:hypothetical protein